MHDFSELKTSFLNFKIFYFTELESTNSYLKNNLETFSDFSVIFTENQTKGRGRFDRKWQSLSDKGLAFSIKIPVKGIPRANWGNLSQIMALSVCLFLEDLGISSCIKWPNDVIVGKAKVCGILGELIQVEYGYYYLILGTGLNVNESNQDFSGLDRLATSILIETGNENQPFLILESLLNKFSIVFKQFVDSGFKAVVSAISKRLFIPDSPVKVKSGDKEITGRIISLTEQGAVLLKTESGLMEIISGEITSRF